MDISYATDDLMKLLEQPPARVPSTPMSGLPQVGARNVTLTSLAGFFRSRGHDQQSIDDYLQALNAALPVPLPVEEVARIAASVARYAAGLDLSERGLSNRFARTFASKLRFSPQLGWLHYDGTCWRRDPARVHVQECAKAFVGEVGDEVKVVAGAAEGDERKGLLRRAASLQNKSLIANITALACSSPDVVDEESWDEPPMLLNFANGTFDLISMTLRDHDPRDRMMKVLPYSFDPQATCPLFDRVLSDALDRDRAAFLMRVFGYSLQGTGDLQKMLVLVGNGRNGKSTIVEAVANALGSYAVTADPNSFLKSDARPQIGNDIAALKGARLVTTAELNTGQALNSGLLKRMHGGEKLKARFLYQEFFEFRPTALLTMVTNFAPVFDGSDSAMAKRLLVVGFENTIKDEDIDVALPRKLQAEAPGIINRLLEGLLAYKKVGLATPQSVSDSTDELVKDRNQALQFLERFCVVSPEMTCSSGDVYARYRAWASYDLGIKPMSQASFNAAILKTIPARQQRSRRAMMWHGFSVLPH